MPSFNDLSSLMQDTIDSVFGECLTISPRINRPNQRSVVDKSRPVVRLTATWQKKPFKTDIDTDNRLGGSSGLNFAKVSAYRVFFYCRVCDFVNEPRQGDHVIREQTGEEYEIHDITHMGDGTFKIEVHERGVFGVSA